MDRNIIDCSQNIFGVWGPDNDPSKIQQILKVIAAVTAIGSLFTGHIGLAVISGIVAYVLNYIKF